MIRTVAEGLVSVLRKAFIQPLAGSPRSAPPTVCCESLESRQLLSATSVNLWADAAAQRVEAPAQRKIAAAVKTVSAKKAAARTSRIVLSAQPASATQVKLYWRQPQLKAKVVDVYALSAISATWARVGRVPAAKTGYTAKLLAPGTQHYFQVIAVSAKGATQGSKIAAAMTRGVAAAPAVMGQPIVITQGGVYSGNFGSDNPYVPAVTIATSEPVVIENSIIRSRGNLIASYYHSANLTVRNTKGYALNPNVQGRYPGRFIDLEGFASLTAENNYLEGTSGIYLYRYAGNRTPDQTIKVVRNIAKNIDGRYSDGKGAFLKGVDDFYNVCFFQTNGIQSLPGIEVAWNMVVNEPGRSRVEDNNNLFNTSGTPDSPVRIHNNYIRGAYAFDVANDARYTGGGIMLSDVGTAFAHAYENQVVATTNYGIGISSGHDNQFYNNRIVSAATLSNGAGPAAQNVGAWIWNMNGEGTFANNSGYGNLIGWSRGGGRSDWWAPNAAYWAGNMAYPGPITHASEAYEYQLWMQKLADFSVAIGPSF